MTVETVDTPAQTPAESFEVENTSRASERFTDVLPATYDDKDDMDLLRAQLNKRKRPIYAGVAFLCVVVIGVSIAVTSGGSAEANTASGISTPVPTTAAPVIDDSATGGVHGADISTTSGSGSVLGEAGNESGFFSNSSSDSGSGSNDTATTTEPTTPPPTADGPVLPYKDQGFEWKNPANWDYANMAPVPASMFSDAGLTLNPGNSFTAVRTKESWGGEKIVLIEWTRTGSSDTNIWMLNKHFRDKQFTAGNNWPYKGELDIFEMFNYDAPNKAGFMGADVYSYGELTMHTGTPGCKVMSPPSHSRSVWYQNTAPMTGASAAQFPADTRGMAVVWSSDGNGKYIQLMANPTVTKGGKIDGKQTYDITPGGITTMKIYNNGALFWNTPVGSPCVAEAGHNPSTGFPFFEEFFLTLEEQNKAGGASFTVTNVQIFRK